MIKNLYSSLEKYKMLLMKVYAEKKDIKVKFSNENKDEIVKQFLSFIGKSIEDTLGNCRISPKRFTKDFRCDLRYKILAVALKRNIVIDSNKSPLEITFVLNRGEVSNLRVGIEIGSNGTLHCDYDEEDIQYSNVFGNLVRFTPYPSDSEKRDAINSIFNMITSRYLEDFVNMLRLMEALNNKAFADIILRFNNNLEETILPKDNYKNPHNRGFWFRVFRNKEFKLEKNKYLSSKLVLAENHIKNVLDVDLEEEPIFDITPKELNDIRWAVDYMGWDWFYTSIFIPYNIPWNNRAELLKTTTEFRRNP